jgi:septum site-determining protein MinC
MTTHTRQADVTSRARRATSAPFQVRGRFFTAIVLQVVEAPDAEFYKALDTILAQAPHFFTNAPFVLDLNTAPSIGPAFDFIGLTRELRKRRITLIGVQNGTIEQNRAALTAGLMTLQGGCDLPDKDPTENGAGPEEPVVPSGALLVTDPVRSGQRVFSEVSDLVVVASVGSGAELIARGNIHVYGRMRGRALAGVNGNPAARIFCQNLEAELIAIGGLYKTSEEIDPSLRTRRVQAFVRDGTLRIEPLK